MRDKERVREGSCDSKHVDATVEAWKVQFKVYKEMGRERAREGSSDLEVAMYMS